MPNLRAQKSRVGRVYISITKKRIPPVAAVQTQSPPSVRLLMLLRATPLELNHRIPALTSIHPRSPSRLKIWPRSNRRLSLPCVPTFPCHLHPRVIAGLRPRCHNLAGSKHFPEGRAQSLPHRAPAMTTRLSAIAAFSRLLCPLLSAILPLTRNQGHPRYHLVRPVRSLRYTGS